MPIFEYVCKECNNEFEMLVQGTNQATCPACESTQLEKKLSGFAVLGNSEPGVPCQEQDMPCATCCESRGPDACPLAN